MTLVARKVAVSGVKPRANPLRTIERILILLCEALEGATLDSALPIVSVEFLVGAPLLGTLQLVRTLFSSSSRSVTFRRTRSCVHDHTHTAASRSSN